MKKTIIKIRSIATDLRIDEYYFWIEDILRWQKSGFNINIVLIDLPILLTNKEKNSRNISINIVKNLLKLGVDPTRVNITFQSQLPEIQEMIVYLQYLVNSTVTDLNYQKSNLETLLEAAIAIIFCADIVLINKWEAKKIEQTRDLINKFNFNFGKILKLPESFASFRPKLVGLDGMEDLNNSNCLLFSDNENIAIKKITAAITDSDSAIKFDSNKKPQISNLINLYNFLTNKTYDEIENEFKGKKYAELKNSIAKQLNNFLGSHIKSLSTKDNDIIEKLVLKSSERIRYKLQKNFKIIKKAMGFYI